MTTKDYIKLAKLIKNCTVKSTRDDYSYIGFIDDFKEELCGILVSDNPRFSKEKFLEACNG